MAVSYPTCTMQKTSGTLYTFPAPIPGNTFVRARSQAMGRTAAGNLVVYDKAATWDECTLTFNGLSATDKTNLEAHFAAVAGGAFTYVNSASTSYTAYFLDSSLQFTQVVRGNYRITIRLRLSASGN